MVAQGPCCHCCEKRQTLIMLLWGDLFPITTCLGSQPWSQFSQQWSFFSIIPDRIFLIIPLVFAVVLMSHLSFSHASGFWSLFPWWFSRACQITDLHSGTFLWSLWRNSDCIVRYRVKFRTCNSCTFTALLSPPLHVLFTVQMVSAGGLWTSVCLAVDCRRLLVGQGSTRRGAFGVTCEMILLSFVLALLAQTSAPSPWVTAF